MGACPTFGEFVPVALKHINNSVIEATVKDRDSRIERFLNPFFGNKKLTKIKPIDIENWQNDSRRINGADITKRTKQLLRRILDRAIMHEYIKANPVRPTAQIREPKVEKRELYTKDEISRMIDKKHGWVSLFVYTMVGLGLRSGEGIVIKFSDINWSNRTITIQRNIKWGNFSNTKTGVSRVVDIPLGLYERLKKEYERESRNKKIDWVFTTPKGDYYGDASSVIKRHFKPLLERLGIEYKTLYSLRHTYATLSLQGGQTINYVSKQLGHKDVETTMKYYIKYLHDDNDLKKADNILSF